MKNDKKLIYTLVFLLIIIVVLIVTIILVFKSNSSQKDINTYNQYTEIVDDELMGQKTNDITRAHIMIAHIEKKYQEQSNYGLDEAKADYESIFNSSNPSLKFHLTREYAEFIARQTNDINKAVQVLSSVEELAGDEVDMYYYSLSQIYDIGGDHEKAQYYQQLINDINSEEETIIMEDE